MIRFWLRFVGIKRNFHILTVHRKPSTNFNIFSIEWKSKIDMGLSMNNA